MPSTKINDADMKAATYVPPMGPTDAKIAIVGEQPGRNEILHKHLGPFSGPSGKNLQECLQIAKLSWTNIYRTNVIKDLDTPISSYIEIRSGKNAKAVATPKGEQYITELKEELAALRPNVVVACGNVALWALCSRIGITNWRGSILDSTLLPGLKVVPTIHPATWTSEKLHANPEAYLNRYLVVLDLKRARAESEYPEIRSTPRKLFIEPTFYEVVSFVHTCIEHAKNGGIIDYDIETTRTNELSCIGLTYSPEHALCIPFIGPHGDYFLPEQELIIMQLLARLFSDPTLRKRGQNVIFDSHFLLRKYGIRTYNLTDTMIAQGIIWPELRKGLDFITSVWTDIPYYKAEGKQFLAGRGDWERGWRYNCQDVLSTATAHPRQLEELAKQGNLATYERQCQLIEPLTYMMERGIRIDQTGMASAAEDAKTQALTLCDMISTKIGQHCIVDASYSTGSTDELNLSSSQQLQDYFYNQCHIKPYTNRESGNPTMDGITLTRIANQGRVEASWILSIRKLMKQQSTFLNITKLDNDGRMRCQYNPVGTKFGRISSSEDIFGTGMNLQNVPHEVLTHFIADEGYILYSLDMSQFENRNVAYIGNIGPMIEAFESGIDVHRLTAAMTLSLMGRPRNTDTVTPTERQDYGKRPNHAFNYGYGYKSYSLAWQVPERDAKRIHEAYHMAYPQLRSGYWAYVQQQLSINRTLTTLMGRSISFLGMWSDALLREAYSAIPQGTCGDLVNTRGILFTYYNTDPIFREVELLTQIHDSITLQMPLNIPLEQHARVLVAIKKSLETPLEWHGRQFVPPVDLIVSQCMNKEKGMEIRNKDFSEDISALTGQLAQALDRLGVDYENACKPAYN